LSLNPGWFFVHQQGSPRSCTGKEYPKKENRRGKEKPDRKGLHQGTVTGGEQYTKMVSVDGDNSFTGSGKKKLIRH